MQAAKGQLADLVVQQATALGIPCDEAQLAADATGEDTLSCTALAEALIDEIVETTKAAVAASASATSGIFFPPGVYAVPHEAGQTQPGKVTITVSPTADAPVSGWACPATVTMAATFTAPDTAFGQAKFPDLNVGYDTNYGAGNGICSIARGTVPLALFGAERYAPLLGRLARPGLVAQALAPPLGAYVLAHDGASQKPAARAGPERRRSLTSGRPHTSCASRLQGRPKSPPGSSALASRI